MLRKKTGDELAKSKKPTVTSFATSPTISGYTGPKNVTPVAPDLGLGKITTPVAVNIGGSIITLPAPNLAPVQKTPVAPSLPPVQKTPIASLRPTVDKSKEKKPLEWGYKYRKSGDHESWVYSLEENYEGGVGGLIYEMDGLEKKDVPKELYGKMLGNNLGLAYLERADYDPLPIEIFNKVELDWRKGWLRFHNELGKDQQETFQVLSDNWLGSPNELVDVVKVIGTYKT